ncbi:brain-specific angiogenesis inhibitor 1-associated protein 2-like protein 1 isoform X3 [Sinocyclocheilus grahami]|nr:PREDICTED: brain-specific angiogenesis inhibitor 1-associated protein 2-like protein 1 isoform X3 [Sinocyclocheilus grahami]
MEQFNPGLRNLINLGKSYEKAVSAMVLAGKQYFDAVSKIGENTAVSPVSRELGVVLMEISDVHRKVNVELEENFRRFHREVIAELERKTEMDVKYMTATFKRYQTEHKMKQDSLERSQSDLKKLKRKSQGKNASKYESKENEARELLTENLTSWQDKCSDASNVPESVISMIEGLRTPQASPSLQRYNRANSDAMFPAPPAPPQTSPLANMFSQESSRREERESVYNNEDNALSRSVSMATGLNHIDKRPKVRTIFPHKSGNNSTLLSFEEGDIITLLIPDERDGWLYGELQKSTERQRGWFPSSYCRAYTEPAVNNSIAGNPPMRSKSVANLMQKDPEDDMMVLPPADYNDSPVRRSSTKSLTRTYSSTYEIPMSQSNGLPKHPILG